MYCEKQGIQTNSILSAEIRAKLSDINTNEGKDIYSVKLGLLDRYLAVHLFSSLRRLSLHVSTPTKLSPKSSISDTAETGVQLNKPELVSCVTDRTASHHDYRNG
jgi:hypothetical protein